jgi:PPP family 3-phenylpropionic acid transporter
MQRRSPVSLCFFYFTAFALLGAYLPYFNLYVESLGFTGLQIGILFAAVPLGKVVFGPLWTYLADRLGSRKGVALLAIVSAATVFSLTLGFDSFPALCVILYLYAALLAPQVPLVEATTLDLAAQHGWQYGRIRVWGSLGFIVTALALGPLFDRVSIRHVLHAVLAVLVANLVATALIPATRPRHGGRRARLAPLLRRRRVIAFFACTLLMQASHGAYYAFFSIFMMEAGYQRLTIGLLWSLGVVAEMATMLGASWLLRRLGVAPVLSACLVVAAVRWLAYSTTSWLPVLLAAQMLHAFTFGAFHVAAVTGTSRLFPAGFRASGQSLYSGLTFGAGSVLGFLAAGRLYQAWGSAALFQASAWTALVAAGLSLVLWREPGLRAGGLARERGPVGS